MPLPPLPIQYPECLEPPTDYRRPSVLTARGTVATATVPPAIVQRLTALCQQVRAVPKKKVGNSHPATSVLQRNAFQQSQAPSAATHGGVSRT